MKLFVSISAVLAWLFGAALLFAPAAFNAPLGIDVTPLIGTLAQAHGATLIGLGTVNWFAARNGAVEVMRPVLAGNLVVQLLSLGVVVWTASLGPGVAVLPGVVIHIALGSGFAYFLARSRA